jgi:hypothetical protein
MLPSCKSLSVAERVSCRSPVDAYALLQTLVFRRITIALFEYSVKAGHLFTLALQ